MLNILSSIICSEFENKVGRWQCKNVTPFAMKVSLRLSVDYSIEEGYRNLHILIYGPMNYVGVYIKEDWTVIPVDEIEDEDSLKPGCDYRKGETGWKVISYHDSCWRTDGVDRILHLHRDRISGIDSLSYWYKVSEITPELTEELEKGMYREEGSRYKYLEGVLFFKKDDSDKIVERIHDGIL